MVVEQKPPRLTVEEYFAMERESVDRHEFIDGHISLMAGGTPDHGMIAANVIAALLLRLRGGPCRVFTSEVRIKLASQRFVYPDTSVSCDERDRGRGEAIQHPSLVAEVLSPSTEAYDRGEKFDHYRACPSLHEYVLVNTRKQLVEVYRRDQENAWTLRTYRPRTEVELTSVDVRVPVAEVYEGVEIPTDARE